MSDNRGGLSIDELVELKVREELAKYQTNFKRISSGWITLRKEINDYIRDEMKSRTKMSYSTCLNAIYTPMKIILGISRIDEMTDEQALIAKDVFKYIKNMTELHNSKRKEDKR